MNAIELTGVSVRYRKRKIRSLKEAVVRGLKGHAKASWVESLRDVTLAIPHGEAVGVVGPNGAGKSTLLGVAAGIIAPTEGLAVSRGSVAPVMSLGAGFEAELSGRENIFFNGALLGCSRAHMRSRLDEIVAFSGLEPFIDAPIRTYSTGMVARLAFSVATAIDAETVLLDEVLAVGDAAFRRKCHERIEGFVASGVTVVLVSHELDAIESNCSRTIWISEGRVAADGPTAEVLARYRLAADVRREKGARTAPAAT